MNSTTLEKVQKDATLMTEAVAAYLGKVNITAQATYDRWPEASGMRGARWELAVKAGISMEQYRHDLSYANVDSTGGRW